MADSGSYLAQFPLGGAVATGLALVLLCRILILSIPSSRKLPSINRGKPFGFIIKNGSERFRQDAKGLLQLGMKGSKAFYIDTDNGPRLILAGSYAHEIRNSPYLDLGRALEEELNGHLPGFEAYRHDCFPPEVGGTLTLTIQRIMKDVHDIDILSVLDTFWTTNSEWHRFSLTPMIFDIAAQLTVKTRSGEELSENPEWRRVTINFPLDARIAASALGKWPRLLRPVINWFLSPCKQVRANVQKARTICTPVIEARLAKKNEAISKGESPPTYHDMMFWHEERANGKPFDAVLLQLLLGEAMIHTIGDLLSQTIFNICQHPQLIVQLRTEISSVISKEGLKTDSLYNLHLLDSVVKESQRLKPVSLTSMKRYASRTIKLSDGTVIPKGTIIGVDLGAMLDESNYTNPLEFQPDRFLKRRQIPGQERSAQLSGITLDHMGFGYGRHACPGRHYAAALVKFTLCHMLLKYDLRLVEEPVVYASGFNLVADPWAEIEIRRRQEDVKF
ncbi:hypothetical protein O1611_g2885 [Lasiodiplodia mahajangana]|uniref:Uncharacterized protein n=1 Tax=Lasiodiplodia mahajangana TaxID=1108764 RepID=A0ACC2JTA8_9PEZI|nr:hypothetical protein O1611_g2885 [Lasiodiplodia mahajangana]